MATVRVFNHHVHSSFYWLALIDALLYFLAFYSGAYLYCIVQLQPGAFPAVASEVPGHAIFFAVVVLVCLWAMGLYEPRLREGRSGVLIRSGGGFAAASLILSAVFYLMPDFFVWGGALFYAVLLSFTANLITRSAFTNLADLDQFKSRVLVLGSGNAASTITSSMRRKTDRQGFNIVGFARLEGEEPRITGERIINLRQPLADYAQQTEIDPDRRGIG